MPKTKLERVRTLLWKMLHWQREHGHDAPRVKAAIEALQDKPEVKPTRIRYPGVAAARDQSTHGGVPGDPSAPNPGAGWCLLFVRLCYGIPAGTPDAITAWRQAQHKHPTTNAALIPRGFPVFWSGGSAGHGHIAISNGDGTCWSTDVKRAGFFDRVPIDRIHEMWGLTLLGWTGDLNGEPVPAEVKLS